MLLKYQTSSSITAFSTTRTSPFNLPDSEIENMGNYAAFNITDYCGDDSERVERNKEWLCAELKIDNKCLWLPHQTHGTNVACIDGNLLKASPEERFERLDNVDALITNLPHQCIGVSTADCVPILLWDKKSHALAAIHAGWRGTVHKIVSHTLRTMIQKYGTQISEIKALIGPSISAAAFEVGNEVEAEFVKEGFPPSIITKEKTNGKPHIDLWAANTFLLEESGVPLQNIQISGICTYQQYDSFFSARRLGIKSGRIFTGIIWNGK